MGRALGLFLIAFTFVAPCAELRDVLKGAEIDAMLRTEALDRTLLKRPNYDVRLVVEEKSARSLTRNPDADQILQIRKGRATISLGNTRRELGPGDVVHLPRNTEYRIDPGGGRIGYLAVRIFPSGRNRSPHQGFLSARQMPPILKRSEIAATIASNDRNQPLHSSNGYTLNYVIYSARPGPFESHRDCVDLYFLQRGTAKAFLGGEIRNAREESPGEMRGDGVTGGRPYDIAEGDLVHIPRKGVHHVEPHGGKVAYLLLKIWAE